VRPQETREETRSSTDGGGAVPSNETFSGPRLGLSVSNMIRAQSRQINPSLAARGNGTPGGCPGRQPVEVNARANGVKLRRAVLRTAKEHSAQWPDEHDPSIPRYRAEHMIESQKSGRKTRLKNLAAGEAGCTLLLGFQTSTTTPPRHPSRSACSRQPRPNEFRRL
jgi:hypothetical protein